MYHVYMVYMVSLDAERTSAPLKLELEGCELLCRHWEMKLRPLEEQPELAEPGLLSFYLFTF